MLADATLLLDSAVLADSDMPSLLSESGVVFWYAVAKAATLLLQCPQGKLALTERLLVAE